MDRSTQFNNAGVACYEAGYPRIAWDLFKGALEVRLAVERSVAQQQLQQQQLQDPTLQKGEDAAATSTSSTTPADHIADADTTGKAGAGAVVTTNDVSSLASPHQPEQSQTTHYETNLAGQVLHPPPQTNLFVEQAEHHMANLSFYMGHQIVGGENNNNNHNQSMMNMHHGLLERQHGREMLPVDADSHSWSTDVAYTPRLFSRPLKLPETDVTTTTTATPVMSASSSLSSSTLSQTTTTTITAAAAAGNASATIIFNLALIDHMRNSCSEHAIALYDLALRLRSGLPLDDVAGIALINNIGVWCYENGDIDNAMNCMSHISPLIIDGPSSPSLTSSDEAVLVGMDEDQRRALRANVVWFMNPTYQTSPAA